MKRREEVDKYRDMQGEDLQAEEARLKESLFRLNFKLGFKLVNNVRRLSRRLKQIRVTNV